MSSSSIRRRSASGRSTSDSSSRASRSNAISTRRPEPDWSDSNRAICPYLSPVGANVIPAAGLAEAVKLSGKLLGGKGRFPADSVVYTATGDGTTAEGEVYEGLRAAINSRDRDASFGGDKGSRSQVPRIEPVLVIRIETACRDKAQVKRGGAKPADVPHLGQQLALAGLGQ